MLRHHVTEQSRLSGYEDIRKNEPSIPEDSLDLSFVPNQAYDAYLRIHKVFVGQAGGRYLQDLGYRLEDEKLPQYLDAAGWAFAESALAQTDQDAVERLTLLNKAEICWEKALISQDEIDTNERYEWMSESNVESYRLALNLAFAPLMKAIVMGDVTEAIREHVFASNLAIAQASRVQHNLARKNSDTLGMSDHVGFEHECNALLALLYLNDPRYIPIPSPARSGTGYNYPEQTHDLVVINQHWGTILKAVPVEVKARATLDDIKRYRALIIRGKMHLSVEGKHTPGYTMDAFARLYEGIGSRDDEKIAKHATSTFCDLLKLYQKGEIVSTHDTHTRFHDGKEVAQNYPELSLNRGPYNH